MALLKCKMCGGNLEIAAGVTVAECEFCGTRQTLPKARDEVIQNLFNRANNLRIKCEFDKAEPIYDKIQKDILNIVKNEKPFDVFLCYKEADENGKRTPDSVIANDIYHQLTQEGLKVFYSAITLEDKLGQAYEPYIFAALNSAKVMLVIGTKPQYFSAVWVKNEWSRFLKLMKSDRSKLLIPCYKDMDAYDLPEEFSHLQAQDMSKIGFINDVVRGIRKVVVNNEPKPAVIKETVITETNTNTAPLLKRAFMFLEDGDWTAANEYCEKVLDIDPECAKAYLGKLMAQLNVNKQESLKDCANPFDSNNHYQKALRFADENLKADLKGYIDHISTRNENARLEGIYTNGKKAMISGNTELMFTEAAQVFESIHTYKDSAALAKECYEKAEIARKDAILTVGNRCMSQVGAGIKDFEAAIQEFQKIPGWKDADEKIPVCRDKIEKLKVRAESKRLEQERKAEQDRQKAKRNKKIAVISAAAVCAVIAFIIVLNTVIIRNNQYNDAVALMESGDKAAAVMAFGKLGDYRDAKVQCAALWEEIAVRQTISAGNSHTVGLKADGTVVAVGSNKYGQCDVDRWTDIAAISAGAFHTVGLKTDGTVVVVGSNSYDQCNVNRWSDIVSISAGDFHTVGLKADGTVVAVGWNYNGACEVDRWSDIVAVSAGDWYTVGLKADGTIVAVGYNGNNQCDVFGWSDIVAISAGGYHTAGLKSDGSVVAVGSNNSDRCNVSGWTAIVAISAGTFHTVGLKSDGTAIAVGQNNSDQCGVSGWTDIVAISAGEHYTVGLKADGTVVAVGDNGHGQCDVSDWTNIKLPN